LTSASLAKEPQGQMPDEMNCSSQTRSDQAVSLNAALDIADDAWQELQRSPDVQKIAGGASTGLPDLSLAEAERRSGIGRSLLRRLEAIDLSAVPRDLALTLRLVRFRARAWAREAEWYWNVLDSRRLGQFGLFLPTAYCGGALLNLVHHQLGSFAFQEPGDTDRYLALVAAYARLIDQFTVRTLGQAQRGIRMPRVQVLQARALLSAFKSGARTAIGVAPQRLLAVPGERFARELDSHIETSVEPAFDRALEGLSDDYLERAPDAVGLGQYPGGAELYAELVKLNTTMDLTPEQVQARGFERMTEIEASIDAIQAELGVRGDRAVFVAKLNADPRWRANTIDGVTALFQRYMDRLKPRLPDYFSTTPEASYGVAPLPEALQGSMTWGYYDFPRNARNQNLYRFNAANLTKQALFSVAALTYHELMPGHHLHLASQQENANLHPFRAHSFVSAYVEGWAEYAATFAGEIGMYELPEERYGRLMLDAIHTSRLVVDTGMNVLGWPLARAREYMLAHTGLAESEILTEAIRYSCDIPGQGLAYRIGNAAILSLRERMRRALGARFDLKDFHSVVLGPGAIPMSDLEWHVDREIETVTMQTKS
jgi:uncharacterized protein (DUF885 family)